MIRTLFITLISLAPALAAATTTNDIHRLLDEVHYAIEQEQPSAQTLETVEKNLRATLELLRNRTPRLMCMKNSNGLYYPTNPANGTILGDSSYSAGHATIDNCKATLQVTESGLSCFLRSNGLYYPTNPQTGAIVGSGSYSAGHPTLSACLSTLN